MSKKKNIFYILLFVIIFVGLVFLYFISFKLTKNNLTKNFLNFETINVENIKQNYIKNQDNSVFLDNATSTSYFLLSKDYNVIFYSQDRENFPVENYFASLGNNDSIYNFENYVLNGIDGNISFTDANGNVKGAIVKNFILDESNYSLVYVIDTSVFYKDNLDSLFYVLLFVTLFIYIVFVFIIIILPYNIKSKEKTVYIQEQIKDNVTKLNDSVQAKVQSSKIYDNIFLENIIDKVNTNEKYKNTFFLYFKIYGTTSEEELIEVENKACKIFIETEIFNSFITKNAEHQYISTFVNSSQEEVARVKELYKKIFKEEFGNKYVLHIYDIDLDTINYAIKTGDLNL